MRLSVPAIELCSELLLANKSAFDGVVVVSPKISQIPHTELRTPLQRVSNLDRKADSCLFVAAGEASSVSQGRIVFSGTGPIDRDYDDVRSYERAAFAGVERAIEAGCKRPLVYVVGDKFGGMREASMLGALRAAYVPIEAREFEVEGQKVDTLGFFGSDKKNVDLVRALEMGRIASRDIGGSDPERMAAPK